MQPDNKQNGRLLSLDALRGFDMMFIMGMASIVTAICCLFPGGSESWLYSQMEHAAWHGLRHHDTIFPLFLFIAGASFPFSLAKQRVNGRTTSQIVWKIVRRALTLVILGILYNGFLKFEFPARYTSVLGRIGIAWMCAAFLYMFVENKWIRVAIATFILVGFWLLLRIPAPDYPGADPLSVEGNMVGYLDRLFMPGRLNDGNFDAIGLLSTFPAIVTAMLGTFTGEWVRNEKVSGGKKTIVMLAAAAVMAVVAILWSQVFPINKKLWSSTFVLAVGAYSIAMFALFYYIIDVRGWRKWCFPFVVIGMNSITVYMGQRIFSFSSINNFFFGGLAGLCPEAWGKLILAVGYFAVVWLFLYFLYKKKIFLKI